MNNRPTANSNEIAAAGVGGSRMANNCGKSGGVTSAAAAAAAVSNNLQDVQKLQQELQEIKEQVSRIHFLLSICT